MTPNGRLTHSPSWTAHSGQRSGRRSPPTAIRPSGARAATARPITASVLGDHLEPERRDDAVDGLREHVVPHVGLDQLDVPPAAPLGALAGLREHPQREVHGDDAAGRTDGVHQVREVYARPAGEIDRRVAGAEVEGLDRAPVEAAGADEVVGRRDGVVDRSEPVVEVADGLGSEDAGGARGARSTPEERAASGEGGSDEEGLTHGREGAWSEGTRPPARAAIRRTARRPGRTGRRPRGRRPPEPGAPRAATAPHVNTTAA